MFPRRLPPLVVAAVLLAACGTAQASPPPWAGKPSKPPKSTPAPTTTPPATFPPPPTTPPPLTGWPDGSNTGVPAGTVLTPYDGPCTITVAGTVIDAVDASACLAIVVRARDVVIRRSLLPRVEQTDWTTDWSVTVSDSRIDAGDWVDGALWGYNLTAERVNITGGQHSVHCAGNCTVTDSWLHGQYNPDGRAFHTNAFITNGGADMLVRHNTLHCDSILNSTNGGCTADVSLFGDFDPVERVTIENNLLKANDSSISYCAYGGYQPSKPYPVSTYIVYRGNTFERGPNGRCGVYGPVTSWLASAAGNEWSGNVFDDGTPVNP